MGCCEYFNPTAGGAQTFTVNMPRVTFGQGALDEVGERARTRGLARVALMTDPYVAKLEHAMRVRASLRAASIDFAEYTATNVEPTDSSVLDAAGFVRDGRFDGVISVGGGSVIDTAKAALVYAEHPSAFTTYFAPPIGAGQPVPGPLSIAHIACPTTGGTGSEATAVSVIRIQELETKFVLYSPYILPTEAIIDPACAQTLPATVMASTGFDLLSHAIESYTAKAFTQWPHIDTPQARPMLQGANPWSDLHAREALNIVGRYLERAVADADDQKARGELMWGATLAGMAFGNTGTHLPHALCYGVSHIAQAYQAADYPQTSVPFVPHGISVIVTAPSVFRYVACAAPERHLEAATCLGADTRDATNDDAGEVVAGRIVELMKGTGVPNGLTGVGLKKSDAVALAESSARQKRAIGNAPRDLNLDDLTTIFERAVSYW